jgi:hypothetical protein
MIARHDDRPIWAGTYRTQTLKQLKKSGVAAFVVPIRDVTARDNRVEVPTFFSQCFA